MAELDALRYAVGLDGQIKFSLVGRRCQLVLDRSADSSACATPVQQPGTHVCLSRTDLSGLHKEEYINRYFSGELSLPTSEVRQVSNFDADLRSRPSHVLR